MNSEGMRQDGPSEAARAGDGPPPQRPGWLLREILRLYTYPFVLIAWLVVPPLRAPVVRYMRSSVMIWKVFVEPFRAATEEAREAASDPSNRGLDGKVIGVFVTAALCLTLLEYFGMSNRFFAVSGLLKAIGLVDLGFRLERWMGDQLHRLVYWAVACFVCYFVIPAAVVKLAFRDKLSDYGLGLKGALKDAWIYVLFFGTVAPAIAFVSFDPHFQSTYPFYDVPQGEPLWPRFWMWEALYFTQFFALEFFFRGFMVHGLRHRLGYYGVAAMMVPYCMIHFGKPFPETLGAVIAGIVLGSLSLKARSIWLGVAIHASVALSMDFAALWQKGLLR